MEHGAQIGGAKLWYDRAKWRFYLLVSLTIDTPDPTPVALFEVIGIDLGQRYLATLANALRGVFPVGGTGRTAGPPVLLPLAQPGVGDCAWQNSGGLVVFEELEPSRVPLGVPCEYEGLPHQIRGGGGAVSGFQRRRASGSTARVGLADGLLLCQVHLCPRSHSS
jgi:hypothetical protein